MSALLNTLSMRMVSMCISMLRFCAWQSKRLYVCLDDTINALTATGSCDCMYCALQGDDLKQYVQSMFYMWILDHEGMSVQGFYSSTHVRDLDMYEAIDSLMHNSYIIGPATLLCHTHEDMRYYTRAYWHEHVLPTLVEHTPI